MAGEIEGLVPSPFIVDADGETVRMEIRGDSGLKATLVLPAHCASQLMITLPRMVQSALLRKERGDPGGPASWPTHFRLESGEYSAEQGQQYLLTIRTDDGFTVSLAGSEDHLSSLARSIFEVDPPRPAAGRASHQF